MSLNWRDTLASLRTQFEARAARSSGLNHLFIEVADHEREKMGGPSWFEVFSRDIEIVAGKPVYRQWDASRSSGLPGVSPGFRAAKTGEQFEQIEANKLIRDGSGVVRAVATSMKSRQGYFCGQPSDEVSRFDSLANAAATALASAKDLHSHVFASELIDLFREPRGGVRYVFGEVQAAPNQFMSSGWNAGVLQYPAGVVIDVPISEKAPDASHWLLLLHRLGWRQIEGSGLRAIRMAWSGNLEITLESLSVDRAKYLGNFAQQFAGVSKESFYSILGTKDAPIDTYLASAFAIQILLADLSPNPSAILNEPTLETDYSREEWNTRDVLPTRVMTHDEARKAITDSCAMNVKFS
jgi:hypothetical protein